MESTDGGVECKAVVSHCDLILLVYGVAQECWDMFTRPLLHLLDKMLK